MISRIGLMVLALAACPFSSSICAGQTLATALQKSEAVYPADSVVDQIGVSVHLSFFNTPYNRFEDLVRPTLLDSGIRHIRDGAFTNMGPDHPFYRRLRTLAADGLKFSLITFDATSPAYKTDLQKLISVFEWSGRAVELFEGTNEPNLKSIPDWANISREHQKELYRRVHSEPELSQISVLGPSPWGASAQQIGDLSGAVDYANWHIYSGGQYPESQESSSLADYIEQANHLYKDKKLVATEAGYHSAMNVPLFKHRPTPEPIVARYLPRLILWNLKNKVVRTYLYELIDSFARGDSDPESNFGLIRADGTKKASYFAIKNLISFFSDPGPSFSTTPLFYSVPDKSMIETMVFQKRNGRNLLAAWIALPSWNPRTRTYVQVAAKIIDLQLPSQISHVSVHTFGDDGNIKNADLLTPNGTATLMVTDQLTILEF